MSFYNRSNPHAHTNEDDGSVTMEIQGTEEQIDKVLLAVEQGRFVEIESIDSRTIPVKPEESGFRTW